MPLNQALKVSSACLLSLGMALAAHASQGDALLQAHGCLSCHAKLEKVLGPSFLSVADKYRQEKDAEARLVLAIQNGSKGQWGRIPMPPHSSISQADLQAMARHVLATQN
jgi:cytochrome c